MINKNSIYSYTKYQIALDNDSFCDNRWIPLKSKLLSKYHRKITYQKPDYCSEKQKIVHLSNRKYTINFQLLPSPDFEHRFQNFEGLSHLIMRFLGFVAPLRNADLSNMKLCYKRNQLQTQSLLFLMGIL